MRPLIGVTTSELRPSHLATTRRQGEPAHPEMALGMSYMRTLDAAGAIPVVLPPVGLSHVDALLDRFDAICLSGGPDLDPAAYGATTRHPELGPTEPTLDEFELSLAGAALERGMPILAICRGAQALNVACGGTLHQHVPGHRQARAAATAAMIFSADDTCDVGKEGGALVAEDYPRPNDFTGQINWVEIDVDDAAVDADHRLEPDELLRVAMARQ